MDQAAVPNISIFDETTRTLSPIPDRKCPLCKSDIRLFFINFNDKMLMCENAECEFPFGHEDLQFVKENHQQHCDMELDSESIKRMSTPAVSGITKVTSGSGIERINKACLSEDTQFDCQSVDVQEFINTRPIKPTKPDSSQNNQDIQENLTIVREYQEKLLKDRELESTPIRSDDLLLKLAALQKNSGSNILTPLEVSILKGKGIDVCKKKEESIKIDIKKEGDNIFQIDLEILDDGE